MNLILVEVGTEPVTVPLSGRLLCLAVPAGGFALTVTVEGAGEFRVMGGEESQCLPLFLTGTTITLSREDAGEEPATVYLLLEG